MQHTHPAVFSSDNERQLFERACAGDTKAFDQLMEPHLRNMRKQVRLYFKNFTAGDAEDVVQETLLNVWLKLDKFQGRSKFSAWLYGAVFRNSLHRLRSLRTRREVAMSQVDDAAGYADSLMQPESNEPSAQLEAKQLLTRIAKAFDSTNESFSEALQMYELAGMSYAEIAAELDCPEGTVKSRISRGRHALQSALTE